VFAAQVIVQEQNLIVIQEIATIYTMIILTAEVMEMHAQNRIPIVMRDIVSAAQAHVREQVLIAVQEPAIIKAVTETHALSA
jgi:hypothetical protein